MPLLLELLHGPPSSCLLGKVHDLRRTLVAGHGIRRVSPVRDAR